jgi:hypothetical protein
MITIPKREPAHSDINIKTIGKINKMTAFEEFQERKIMEKIEKTTITNDSFLLMTLCEIIKNKELFALLSIEEKMLVDFRNPDYLRILLSETKTRQSCNIVTTMLVEMCHSQKENTAILFDILVKQIENNDYSDLEFTMKIFTRFMFINDEFKKSRV